MENADVWLWMWLLSPPATPLQIFRKLCERLECRAQACTSDLSCIEAVKGTSLYQRDNLQRLPSEVLLCVIPSSLMVSPLYYFIKPIRMFYCWINNPLTRLLGIYISNFECLIQMQCNFQPMSNKLPEKQKLFEKYLPMNLYLNLHLCVCQFTDWLSLSQSSTL